MLAASLVRQPISVLIALINLASCERKAGSVTDGTALLQVLRTRGGTLSPIGPCDIYPCGQTLSGSALQYPIALPQYSSTLLNPGDLHTALVDRQQQPGALAQLQDNRWLQPRPQPMMQPLLMQGDAGAGAPNRFEIDVSRFSADVGGIASAVAALSADVNNVQRDLEAIAGLGASSPKHSEGALGIGGVVDAGIAAQHGAEWQLAPNRPLLSLPIQSWQEGLDWQLAARRSPNSVVAVASQSGQNSLLSDIMVLHNTTQETAGESNSDDGQETKVFLVAIISGCILLPCALGAVRFGGFGLD